MDNHGNIQTALPAVCKRVDQPGSGTGDRPEAARSLDSTIVWGGEIGRLPGLRLLNRLPPDADQRPGLSIWLAGGGIKGGMTYGNTDEFGHRAVENVVTPNDYQAT
ncbi:MAG: DUF1501 domain-containing protein [Planctomycetaceae bacterium]